MRKLAGLAVAAALAACAPAQDNGPSAVVEALYAPYLEEDGAPPGLFGLAVLTPELKAEIDRAVTYSSLLEIPVIDYDPIAQAQDWVIRDVVVTEAQRSDDAATVIARFDNMGRATEVTYRLRQDSGAWRIDEIGADGQTLRGVIADALKPAGAPSAMEVPVRAIYDVYRAATRPVAPLQRWAPLSADLRARLAAGELEFDPIVDGKGLGLGPVQYEPAAASVIVRFTKDGAPRLLVYDLVEEAGAWKVADIRSPGHWGLVQKLSGGGGP